MVREIEQAHHRLIDQLIARGALWSQPLITAFRNTPRHLFLDRVYHFQRQEGNWRVVPTQPLDKAGLKLVFSDRALITHLSASGPGQSPMPISSSSQPSLMAQMLEDLQVASGLDVLEIGAGTGYNAALLAAVGCRVVSVDVDRRVLAEAESHLQAFGQRTVELVHADGRTVVAGGRLFDRIMVTAATPDLEPVWLTQLREGGMLLAPLALAPGLACTVRGQVHGGFFEGRLVRPAYFMPLRTEEGATGPDPTATAGALPAPNKLHRVAAPWGDWSERKTLPGAPGYGQALAFLAWLAGLTVAYQAGPDERPTYGVADMVHGHACWLGQREWRVTGKAGHELARRLWRTYLDAGGPWPTEFRLRAWPIGGPEPTDVYETPAARLTYRRAGGTCRQVWELLDPRERAGWF
jgi:protein-L-isoaspartate(D-aspartate) O-methyltransferase